MTLTDPARDLIGKTVLGEWLIEESINLKSNGSTGGNFCIPYKARNIKTGQRGFLKVLDVIKAIQIYGNEGVSVLETLNRITTAHIFESQLMDACKEKKLTRVVRALEYGEIALDVPPLGNIGFPFLIFELADGDTHKLLQTNAVDLAWWLSTLHQAAVGIQQLHGLNIAHQDLKPSNVVFFGVDDEQLRKLADGTIKIKNLTNNSKLTDLGRAARKGVASKNDGRVGDFGYMPPEYYYGYRPLNWGERFLAMDLYLLGNLAFTAITGISITTAIFSQTPPEIHWVMYHGDYPDVVPALTRALAEVLQKVRDKIPEPLRELLITTIQQLCQPDPAKRGHPKNHEMIAGAKYSVERYVSAFHRMKVIAEMELRT